MGASRRHGRGRREALRSAAEELREERHAQPLLRELDVPAWQEVAVMRPRWRAMLKSTTRFEQQGKVVQWIWGRRAETAPLVNRASQTEGKASPGKGPQQRVAKGGGGSFGARERESAQQP